VGGRRAPERVTAMSVSVWSYGSAGVAYAVLSVLLLLGRRSGRGQSVLLAVAGTALWGAAITLAMSLSDAGPRPAITVIPDALRTLAWILFLSRALPSRAGWHSVKHVIAALAWTLAAATVALPFVAPRGDYYANLTLLALTVAGCLTIEQLVRNSSAEQRRVFRLFFRTVTVLLVFDLLVFSNAVLPAPIDADLWMARGFLATAAVPLLLVGIAAPNGTPSYGSAT
jgi:hypothetical protein